MVEISKHNNRLEFFSLASQLLWRQWVFVKQQRYTVEAERLEHGTCQWPQARSVHVKTSRLGSYNPPVTSGLSSWAEAECMLGRPEHNRARGQPAFSFIH